jgi:hypothetical protein
MFGFASGPRKWYRTAQTLAIRALDDYHAFTLQIRASTHLALLDHWTIEAQG